MEEEGEATLLEKLIGDLDRSVQIAIVGGVAFVLAAVITGAFGLVTEMVARSDSDSSPTTVNTAANPTTEAPATTATTTTTRPPPDFAVSSPLLGVQLHEEGTGDQLLPVLLDGGQDWVVAFGHNGETAELFVRTSTGSLLREYSAEAGGVYFVRADPDGHPVTEIEVETSGDWVLEIATIGEVPSVSCPLSFEGPRVLLLEDARSSDTELFFSTDSDQYVSVRVYRIDPVDDFAPSSEGLIGRTGPLATKITIPEGYRLLVVNAGSWRAEC